MKQALIFPGQGAQYCGMGKDFYDNYAECKEIFDHADDLLSTHLSKLMFSGPMEDLTQTQNSQLAIYVMSLAIEKLIGVLPDTCAGLSLGEYSAVVASGRLSFEEGLKLVKARGQFMQEACLQNPGTMAVVLGLPEALVDQLVLQIQKKHRVWVANLNCPRQVVLAGTKEGIAAAEPIMKEKGAKRFLELEVSGAFHSELMKPAQEKLEPVVDSAPFKESSISLVMNVPGNYVTSLDEVRHFLNEQVVYPVKWEKGIHAMEDHGIERYIEIGPGKTLAGMNRKIGVKGTTISIEKVGDLDALA
ncbi:MAG TPA: ACP S-malonyltransferase [Chlamydiales bacterium]|nr:ACP S-malonyltransferase [Chlamydiales bacterium]